MLPCNPYVLRASPGKGNFPMRPFSFLTTLLPSYDLGSTLVYLPPMPTEAPSDPTTASFFFFW